MIEQLLLLKEPSPLLRLIILINVLTEIAHSKEVVYLAGAAYENKKVSDQELKIKRIINFMTNHYNDSELSLDKLANMTSMSAT